jgi:hypothetical protein
MVRMSFEFESSQVQPPPVTDLSRSTTEDWEQLRRSVAMLPPRSWAVRREEALQVLETLIGCLRR